MTLSCYEPQVATFTSLVNLDTFSTTATCIITVGLCYINQINHFMEVSQRDFTFFGLYEPLKGVWFGSSDIIMRAMWKTNGIKVIVSDGHLILLIFNFFPQHVFTDTLANCPLMKEPTGLPHYFIGLVEKNP